MTTDAEVDWLTVEEVAGLCGVSHWTVRSWTRRGWGPAFYRVGNLVRYRRRDVETWLEARRQPGSAAS